MFRRRPIRLPVSATNLSPANYRALRGTRLAPAVAPKEIAFSADLPRTRSGKIMRRLLRARELGLPEGDLSTLEEAPSLITASSRA